MIVDNHMAGTGEWFLESREFLQFVSEQGVILWGTGPRELPLAASFTALPKLMITLTYSWNRKDIYRVSPHNHRKYC